MNVQENAPLCQNMRHKIGTAGSRDVPAVIAICVPTYPSVNTSNRTVIKIFDNFVVHAKVE
jgi:hypothetical protein